jgi:hypothetical protein
MEARPIDGPFRWAEIDAPAQKKLIQLEQVLRAEVTKDLTPFPAGQGEQARFLLMLEDQANKWVERADEAYSQCLIEVGREKSNEATRLVWKYGLSHFIREQVRDFLYLACGIDDTLRTVSAYSPQFPFLEDVMQSELQRVRRVDEIVERLQGKWEKKLSAEMHAQSSTLPLSLPKVVPTVTGANSRPKNRLNYRSKVRRAIQAELIKNPNATNIAICRALDADGNAELPRNWQPKPGEREFVKAYNDRAIRPRIEKMISKVRAEMRNMQLLPPR